MDSVSASDPISAGSVAAFIQGLTLPMGLVVDEVEIQAKDAYIIPQPFKLDLAAPAELTARISAASVADFLSKKAPGNLKNFEVSIRSGSMDVSATAKILFEVTVKATCHLEIRNEGKELHVVLDDVDVLGVGARTLVQQQIDAINPIVTTADLPLEATLREVTLDGGLVTLKASAQWSA